MNAENNLQQLYQQELIPEIDWHFARLIQRFAAKAGMSSTRQRQLLWLAALASHAAAGRGDVGVPLDSVADAAAVRDYLQLPPDTAVELPAGWGDIAPDDFPGLIGDDPHGAPLVLDDGVLYLASMYIRTGAIRHFLDQRQNDVPAAYATPEDLRRDLAAWTALTLDDDQVAAIRYAEQSRFFIISGGPGAGKTTIAALVLARRPELLTAPERVLLCAPTGKARATLVQSICQMAQTLPEPLRQNLLMVADNAITIHKLLKIRFDSPHGPYGPGNPLPCDLVIADECSMISHSLMAELMAALPEHASLILLGDSAQLNSVDPGAVFRGLCDRFRHDRRHLAVLTGNHRFAGNAASGIGRMQRLLLSGDDVPLTALTACFETGDDASLVRYDMPGWEMLPDLLKQEFRNGWFLPDGRPYRYAGDFQTAWQMFDSFRILAAVNNGPCGADQLNRISRQLLGFPENGRLQPGMAIMILQNDWQLGVANGEIGMVWPAAADGTPAMGPAADAPLTDLRVFFPAPDGDWCGYVPGILPEYTDAYAYSIHKSQGSGYGRVLILVPELQENAASLLTRELIYTAVTRAKKRAIVVSPAETVARALSRRTDRFCIF